MAGAFSGRHRAAGKIFPADIVRLIAQSRDREIAALCTDRGGHNGKFHIPASSDGSDNEEYLAYVKEMKAKSVRDSTIVVKPSFFR